MLKLINPYSFNKFYPQSGLFVPKSLVTFKRFSKNSSRSSFNNKSLLYLDNCVLSDLFSEDFDERKLYKVQCLLKGYLPVISLYSITELLKGLDKEIKHKPKKKKIIQILQEVSAIYILSHNHIQNIEFSSAQASLAPYDDYYIFTDRPVDSAEKKITEQYPNIFLHDCDRNLNYNFMPFKSNAINPSLNDFTGEFLEKLRKIAEDWKKMAKEILEVTKQTSIQLEKEKDKTGFLKKINKNFIDNVLQRNTNIKKIEEVIKSFEELNLNDRFKKFPFITVYDLLYQKQITGEWSNKHLTANDIIDAMHLAYAASYCDVLATNEESLQNNAIEVAIKLGIQHEFQVYKFNKKNVTFEKLKPQNIC